MSSLASCASLAGVIALASVGGCYRGPTEEVVAQRLVATVELVHADGTPVAGRSIDAYRLTFVVADGHEIERTFAETPVGLPLRADDAGRVLVFEGDLALSYDWQRDEWVCEDVCAEWVTTCQDVAEEVCVEQCEVVTYDECWDECQDDCETVCYDRTYCDDEGCWTETVCDDVCTTTCERVCQPVTEEQCWDECHTEIVEQCADSCAVWTESCGWVTRTYTTYPALSDVVATRSEILLKEPGGVPLGIAGDVLRAEAAEADTWVESDRFTLPQVE